MRAKQRTHARAQRHTAGRSPQRARRAAGPWALLARRCCALLRAVACSRPMGWPCSPLLASLLARWALHAYVLGSTGRQLRCPSYSRFNIFPIYYLSFRIRRITVVRYDLFVSPSLRIFAIRYTIPTKVVSYNTFPTNSRKAIK